MPVVEMSEVVAAAAPIVWDVINDVESFPRLLEHVRSLTVLERGPEHRVTAWEVSMKCSCACAMQWVEREEIHPEIYRIDRRAIKGDLTALSGYWQIEPLADESSRVTLSMRFEINIPGLGAMVEPFAEGALREISQKTLASLGMEAAQRQASARLSQV